MSAKILIVDDESSARLTLENLLFSEGYTLQFAQDGPDGLARALAWQPDVILSDVMMPGMDGFEFCRRIRRDASLGQVPIILLTAIADRQARLIGLQAGADEFVTKPIDSVELRTRLRTLTRLDRFRKLNDERLKLEQAHQELLLAHEALGESETHFRTFVEQAADGVMLADERGVIIEWNPALVQITGLEREQALGLTLWELQFQMATPEKRLALNKDRLKDTLHRMLSGQSGFFGRVNEAEIQTVHGETRFIEQTSFPIQTTRGHRLGTVVRDITEHKRAEDARRESDERYHLLFQTMVQGVVFQDADGHIIQANPAAERILGLTIDQMQGRTSIDPRWHAIHEDGTPFPGETHPAMAALHTGQPVHNVVMGVFNPALDAYRWVNINAVPRLLNGGPQPYQVYTTFEDITARQLAEAELRISEARFATIFHSSPSAIAISRRTDNTLIDVNSAWENTTGWSREAAVGKSPLELNLWARPAEREQLKTLVAEQGAVQGYEMQLRTRAGANLSLLMSAELITLQGEPCLLSMTQDITARKHAETELRLAERRYRALIENAPDGVVLISADGKFKYASPSVERIFGYTQEDLPDCEAVGMTHPDDLPRLLPELAALLAEPTRVPTVQYRFRHKNGDWRWIESTFSNLLTLPSVASIIINFRDIHERKLAEEALNRSEALLTEAQRIGRMGHMEWNGRDQALICSDELYAIFDSPCDAVMSQDTLAGMMHPDERERIQQLDLQAFQQRTDMDYEYTIRLTDGRDRWVHQISKMTYGENGFPTRMMAIVQDVTERKQTEQALHETQLRQEMALKGANAGTWEWNVQTGEAVFNERWAQMVGYTLAELEPISIQTWITLCQPDDLKISDQLLQQHFAGETEYYECEARLRHKNGAWVWVIDYGKVMEWDTAGKPVRMFGTHLDITERKREENFTQARLRLANLSYQKLDMLTLMRTMLDEAEVLTDSQIGFFHFVDDDQNTISLQAWSTHTLRTLCTAEGQGQHYPVAQAGVWADGIRDGQPHIYNAYASLPDRRDLPEGHAPITRLISLPIKRRNKVVAAIGMGNKPRDYNQQDLDLVQRLAEEAFDIVLRRRAEEALRASEEKYRGLLESLDSVVVMLDGEGRCLYMNEVAGRQLGGTPEQFTGRNVTDLFPEPIASRQLQMVQQAVQTDQPSIATTESILQGQLRWYRSSIQPIHDETGRVVYALLNATDITPIMTVQTQMEELNRSLEDRVALRTQELAEANTSLAAAVDRLQDLDRLKSKFVSDVSHELRTPITSLSVYVELLTHGKPEKREQYVGKLQEQMARLHKLINDILDLSRLERDRDEGGRSPVDLNSIVEHVSAMERGAAETAGLTLTCEVADQLPPVVVRPDQLTRAITNLVANAVKYTPTGSVRVQTAERDGRVCIEVADTGRGIPADELPHLFERFYRGREVAQSHIPGTGLGLSIVKEIIESHGGTVEVASELGVGSTFRIWLPAA